MGLLVAWAVIIAIRAYQNAVLGGLSGIVAGGIIIAIGVVGTAWCALGLGLGAVSCQVTPDGFTLVYQRGRTIKFVWNDPSVRFTLFELLYSGRLTYSIGTRRPFLNPIPQELFQAILSEARSRGLSVTEHLDTLPGGHQLKIRVRGVRPARES
jgi:hypothetical protein